MRVRGATNKFILLLFPLPPPPPAIRHYSTLCYAMLWYAMLYYGDMTISVPLCGLSRRRWRWKPTNTPAWTTKEREGHKQKVTSQPGFHSATAHRNEKEKEKREKRSTPHSWMVIPSSTASHSLSFSFSGWQS